MTKFDWWATISALLAGATSIAQQLIIQAGHMPEDVYDYVSEHPVEEILENDAKGWAAPSPWMTSTLQSSLRSP